MLSTIELLIVISCALVMAQAVAWLFQRMVAVPLSQPAAGLRRSPVGLWAETTRAHFHYVRRRTRYQVDCPVVYQTQDSVGQGLVTDMSREGWRIQASEVIPVGTVVSLSVELPGHATPVSIERAVVRWSESQAFGVSLVTLAPDPAAELSEFFSTLTLQPTAGSMREES